MREPIVDEIPGSDSELVAVLAQAGLPIDDLGLPGRRFFRFHYNGRLAGFVGWETADDGAVLLRSLAVVPSEQGKGLGAAIVRWALARLAELGFTDAYLLTTTIEALAQRLGFCRLDRNGAPASIRQSRQFAGLCPASAVLMYRRLP